MKTPFPITYRELWLPQHIRGTHLPPSAPGGHALTLTGASKQTTADGVHFTGGATSNIVVAANALQNGKAACHITIRFKLDQTFAAGAAGNFYFINKVNLTTYIRVYLKAIDGKFYWEQDNGAGGAGFSLTSTTVSWTAGTWYIVTVEMADTPTQRLLVNGTLEDSDISAAVVTPAAGDIIIGSSSDGGTDGVVGTISWVVIGVGATATVALTAAEETNLSNGVPPPTAKVQYMYLMDEGRGLTATDRGSAGGNGTLDTACTWQFGQVKAPCLSLDGINDYASIGSGINIAGALTWALVVRCKSTLAASIGRKTFLQALIDGNNYLEVQHGAATAGITAIARGSASQATCTYATLPAIDDCRIYMFTLTQGGVITLYNNGSQEATSSGAGAISAASANLFLGSVQDPAFYVNDQILEALFMETAYSATQVKAYSRYLRDKYNLPGTFA